MLLTVPGRLAMLSELPNYAPEALASPRLSQTRNLSSSAPRCQRCIAGMWAMHLLYGTGTHAISASTPRACINETSKLRQHTLSELHYSLQTPHKGAQTQPHARKPPYNQKGMSTSLARLGSSNQASLQQDAPLSAPLRNARPLSAPTRPLQNSQPALQNQNQKPHSSPPNPGMAGSTQSCPSWHQQQHTVNLCCLQAIQHDSQL